MRTLTRWMRRLNPWNRWHRRLAARARMAEHEVRASQGERDAVDRRLRSLERQAALMHEDRET